MSESIERVWLEMPAGNVRKDKRDIQPLIDTGLVAHDKDTVETYRLTDAGRRLYISHGLPLPDEDEA